MHVIIVGAGRTGKSLIKKLSEEKHTIVAVDVSDSRLADLMAEYDIQCVTGNGCDGETLEEAGVRTTDLLIAVTDSDEMNVLTCILAGTYGVDNVIAHVRDPKYYAQFNAVKEKLGITQLVNPESTLAFEISNLLTYPTALRVSAFAKGKLQIAEMSVSRENRLCGHTLMDLKTESKNSFLIVTIERDGKLFIPNGSTVIQKGDVVSVCARRSEMREVLSYLGFGFKKVRSVMILGSENDVYYLADSLSQSGFSVKVMGRNYQKLREMKEKLDKANVICADFTDKEVLDREGLEHADALVAMSTYDENNIVASMYAKTRGLEKVVTVLRKDSYNGIMDGAGIDKVVSPYELTGLEIAKCVRSIDVPKDSQILSIQPLSGGKAEALLFNIGHNPSFVGRSIRSLNEDMKNGVLIVAIYRNGGSSVIPDGDTVLGENDSVVIASMGHTITQLKDILQEKSFTKHEL